MNARELAGLQRRVANALAKYHGATPGMRGIDWRVGRSLHENVYHGQNIKKMSASECQAALLELNGGHAP